MPEPVQTQDGTSAASASSGTPGSAASAATSPHQTSPGSTTGANAGAAGAAAGASGGQHAAGQQAGQSGSPSAGAGSAAGNGSAAADSRDGWHPPHVNRRLSRENAELKRNVQAMQAQLAVINGITPPRNAAPANLPPGVSQEDVDRARQEFALFHPGLSRLADVLGDDNRMNRLIAYLEAENDPIEDIQSSHWRDRGTWAMREIAAEAKEQIGDLTDRGQRLLLNTFNALLRSDDEFFQRYAAGDPQLIVDFVNDYKAGILDPYHTSRASAAASTVSRARTLPRGGASSSVVPAGAAAEGALDANDPDAIHKRAFQHMQQRRQGAAA